MSNYNYSYFNNDNNENNEMDQLDKMAREINETKKKKFNLVKNVHNDFYEESIRNKKQLEDALNDENFRYFSTQGNINNTTDIDIPNFSNYKSGTDIDTILKNTNKTINTDKNNIDNEINDDNNTKETHNDSFIKSLKKYNIDDDCKKTNIKPQKSNKNKNKDNLSSKSSRDENLSLLLDHLKKEHNSHIFSESESIISNSEDSIIKHLKKCPKCKSKIKLVFDNNHKLNLDDNKNFDNKTFTIKFSDLKEYLVIILLGFLILLIIYIFFKLK